MVERKIVPLVALFLLTFLPEVGWSQLELERGSYVAELIERPQIKEIQEDSSGSVFVRIQPQVLPQFDADRTLVLRRRKKFFISDSSPYYQFIQGAIDNPLLEGSYKEKDGLLILTIEKSTQKFRKGRFRISKKKVKKLSTVLVYKVQAKNHFLAESGNYYWRKASENSQEKATE